MIHFAGAARRLLSWMALVPLLSACESIPAAVSLSPESSLLAVDVSYPIPLSRDPCLVQVFLVKGPIHGGLEELPELIPASFVKNSRAYLIDPEPGTYSLVAVTAAVAAPLDRDPVAGGVTKTTLAGTAANAMIFPGELIQRTRTAIGPGSVAFMGALRVRPGDRINANTVFRDDLQRRIAERIYPGVTSKSGIAGWFTGTFMVDLEKTSFSNEAGDRESFFDAALIDLRGSPWAQFVARAASREAPAARSSPPAPVPENAARIEEPASAGSSPPAPVPESAARIPEAPAAGSSPPAPVPENAARIPEAAAARSSMPALAPESAARIPEPAAAKPAADRELEAATPEPDASPPSPTRQRFPGVPPDSPWAEIELGMRFDEVRRILGDPDASINHLTTKAWIPFYTGRGARLRDWIYEGEGRVVFSLQHGSLEVIDVVYDPNEGK